MCALHKIEMFQKVKSLQWHSWRDVCRGLYMWMSRELVWWLSVLVTPLQKGTVEPRGPCSLFFLLSLCLSCFPCHRITRGCKVDCFDMALVYQFPHESHAAIASFLVLWTAQQPVWFEVASLSEWVNESHLVVSSSLQPHGPYSPSTSAGQNTEVGSLSLLQGIFPTQGLNPGLLHCRQILYQLSHQGSKKILEWVAIPSSRGSSQPRIIYFYIWLCQLLRQSCAIEINFLDDIMEFQTEWMN